MIDLNQTRTILEECLDLVEELDGIEHADTGDNRTKGREERVLRSRQLQLLSDRLSLASSLVRNEYWVARGEHDPLDAVR